MKSQLYDIGMPIDLEDLPPEAEGSAETAVSQKPLKRVRLKEVK
jgi:hypothetical protein